MFATLQFRDFYQKLVKLTCGEHFMKHEITRPTMIIFFCLLLLTEQEICMGDS